jgi:hypothetical protein
MDPFTIFMGVQALVGIAQLWNSNKTAGKNEQLEQEYRAIFNKLKPPNYRGEIGDPPDVIYQELQDPKYANSLSSKFSGKTVRTLFQYIPELEPLIEEKAPELIKDTDATKRGREAQLTALDELQKAGRNEYDPVFRGMVEKAQREAQASAETRQLALQESFARRGLGGSGLELAGQIASGAETMNRLGEMDQAAAIEAYKRRLDSLSQGAKLGGDIAAEDRDVQGRNIDIINRFNQRSAANQQRLAGSNVDTMNNAQLKNIEFRDNMEKEKAEQARWAYLQKLGLAKQQYQDQFQLAQAKSGIPQQGMQNNNQRSYDTANVIQGIGNSASAMADKYGDIKRAEAKKAADAASSSNLFQNYPEEESTEDFFAKRRSGRLNYNYPGYKVPQQ